MTVRLANTCQISDKRPRVTGTQIVVVSAGRRDELAYQVLIRIKELKRDMESSLLANIAEDVGAAGTARALGGIGSWIDTNSDFGVGGSDGSLGNTARTNGTQRVFNETRLKTVLRSCWDNGGDPDCIMVGSFNKEKISGFAGNATREIGAQDRELIATIDLYVGDFHHIQVIANRFQRSRDALILQKDMWAVAYLRPVGIENLSKTGDSERRLLIVEFTLESRNEAASGAVWDVTTG